MFHVTRLAFQQQQYYFYQSRRVSTSTWLIISLFDPSSIIPYRFYIFGKILTTFSSKSYHLVNLHSNPTINYRRRYTSCNHFIQPYLQAHIYLHLTSYHYKHVIHLQLSPPPPHLYFYFSVEIFFFLFFFFCLSFLISSPNV